MNMTQQRIPSTDPTDRVVEPTVDEGSRSMTSSNSLVQTPGGVHTVSAIYPSLAEAVGVRQDLIEQGFPASAVHVAGDSSAVLTELGIDETGRDEVLRNVLVDGAIGTAVGTGVGIVGTVVVAAASVTLFVASPVVAPLAMLGWFAGLGGVVGAAVGANRDDYGETREGKLSELVMAAVEAGNTVLLVHTRNEAEQDLAMRIITGSLQGTDQTPMQS